MGGKKADYTGRGTENRQRVECRAGRTHRAEQETRNRVTARGTQETGIQIREIEGAGAVGLGTRGVVEIPILAAEVQSVAALYPGQSVGNNVGWPLRKKVGIAAIATESIEVQGRLVRVAEYARDLR